MNRLHQVLLGSLLVSHSAAATNCLEEYVASFAQVRPVHVTATISMERRLGDGRHLTGGGTLDYWDDGADRFLVSSRSDASLELAHDLVASFDGLESRYRIGPEITIVSASAPNQIPTLPNPLLQAAEFLRPRFLDCNFCRFGLRDVRVERIPPWTREVEKESAGVSVFLVSRDPVGQLHPGEQIELRFDRSQAPSCVPTRVERRSPRWHSVEDYSDFASSEGFFYPRVIHLHGTDDNGKVVTSSRLVVTAFERAASDTTYSAPLSSKVWDEDAKMWLQRAPAKRPVTPPSPRP